MKKILITGSSGLIGSEAVDFFSKKKFKIFALDNDFRGKIFGKEYSTKKILKVQRNIYKNIKYINVDICNFFKLRNIFLKNKFDVIIHTAGQPSHDWSAKDPILDFKVNALATLNLLELTRIFSPKAVFIFTSTNKVYGDTPNYLSGLKELKTRFEVFSKKKLYSINESMSLDHSKHSPFGVSKLAADVMVQEYGKYFNIKTASFRCGCLTGPNHQGAELHGFLSYLVKCIVNNKPYTIYGHKGKQVRDNIHSYDLVNMFWHYLKKPGYGDVFNAGGGRKNSISILEAINLIKSIAKKDWNKLKFVNTKRKGDHAWYVTDLNKFSKKFPKWKIKYSLKETIKQIIDANQK